MQEEGNSETNRPIRVLVADDHTLFRRAIAGLLASYGGLEIIAQVLRFSAEDRPSHETGLDHEQPLVQSEDALAIHAFDAEPDMFVLVNGKLEEPPDSSVVQPRPLYASFLLDHLVTSSSYCVCATS